MSFAYQREDKYARGRRRGRRAARRHLHRDARPASPWRRSSPRCRKSLRNVVNPDDVIASFGADTFRLYEMYMGPLEASKPWNTRDIAGLLRFLQRAWRLVVNEETGELTLRCEAESRGREAAAPHHRQGRQRHRAPRLQHRHRGADRLRQRGAPRSGGLTRDQAERFARVLAPFAPHMAEELWQRARHARAASRSPAGRSYDEAHAARRQRRGARADPGQGAPPHAWCRPTPTRPTLEKLALADAKVQELIAGKTVRKVIVVPGKLVNLVVG